MKHRKISEQQEKDIQEIVDYYMRFVTGEYHSIRESIEYYWQCMSDYSIEDYLEIVRKRKEQEK
jgi:predicted DNA-binding protein